MTIAMIPPMAQRTERGATHEPWGHWGSLCRRVAALAAVTTGPLPPASSGSGNATANLGNLHRAGSRG